MATSYSNLGGTGNRRNLNIGVWTERPAGSNATFNSNPTELLGSASSLFYQNGAGECRICFDFMEPRVIDALKLFHSGNGQSLGTYYIQGSNDLGGPWTTLYDGPVLTTSTTGTEYAFTNTTAYRYYCLYRPSGNGGTSYYFSRVDFKIDDAADESWWTPYSYGDRAALVSGSGNILRYGYTLNNALAQANAWSAVSDFRFYPNYGPGYYFYLDFVDNVALTGIRLSRANDNAIWDVEGRADPADPWTTIATGVELKTTWSRTLAPTYGIHPSFSEVQWENTNEFRHYRFVVASGRTGPDITMGGIALKIGGASPPDIVDVFPSAGSLALSGLVPDIEVLSGPEVSPDPDDLSIEGFAPLVLDRLNLNVSAGDLSIEGGEIPVFIGTLISVDHDDLTVEGFDPLIFTFTGVISSQIAAFTLGFIPASTKISQLQPLVLGEATRDVDISQIAALALAQVRPPVKASQMVLYALAHGSPCTTQRCQLWTIRRRDGEVFRFTSHDEEVRRGTIVYLPCKSLNATASENASTLGSVGNIELTGIIDHDSITEADLYGGLFDDAFVTVDLYSWGDYRISPRRLAAGWTGSISTGDTGFSLEILGPGSRLEQQALVQMITPSCRWVFGSPQCGVNVDAMKVSAKVVKAFSRGSLTIDLPAEPAGRQWANGRIRFLTGPNAGQTVETKTVDFASGAVVLWQSPGFLSEPGDDVEILPGCDFNRDGGCSVYNNVINFGGFPDVPGADALLETPDAKY